MTHLTLIFTIHAMTKHDISYASTRLVHFTAIGALYFSLAIGGAVLLSDPKAAIGEKILGLPVHVMTVALEFPFGSKHAVVALSSRPKVGDDRSRRHRSDPYQ